MKSSLPKKRKPPSEGQVLKSRRRPLELKTLPDQEDSLATKYGIEAFSRTPYRRIIE